MNNILKMNQQLLKVIQPLLSVTRSKGYKHPGGVRYPGGIVYYPRFPGEKEPEVNPSKLFRVERIKTTRHHPYWQKDILQEFNILEGNRVAIVKNIPEVNAKLWKVKHLIKVTPVVFPFGEPTKDDIKYTVLRENGECMVIKKLETPENQIEALDKFDGDAKKMDSDTIKRDARLKWETTAIF